MLTLTNGKCIPNVKILSDFQKSRKSPLRVSEGSFSASGRFKKDADPDNLAVLAEDNTIVRYSNSTRMQMTMVGGIMINWYYD